MTDSRSYETNEKVLKEWCRNIKTKWPALAGTSVEISEVDGSVKCHVTLVKGESETLLASLINGYGVLPYCTIMATPRRKDKVITTVKSYLEKPGNLKSYLSKLFDSAVVPQGEDKVTLTMEGDSKHDSCKKMMLKLWILVDYSRTVQGVMRHLVDVGGVKPKDVRDSADNDKFCFRVYGTTDKEALRIRFFHTFYKQGVVQGLNTFPADFTEDEFKSWLDAVRETPHVKAVSAPVYTEDSLSVYVTFKTTGLGDGKRVNRASTLASHIGLSYQSQRKQKGAHNDEEAHDGLKEGKEIAEDSDSGSEDEVNLKWEAFAMEPSTLHPSLPVGCIAEYCEGEEHIKARLIDNGKNILADAKGPDHQKALNALTRVYEASSKRLGGEQPKAEASRGKKRKTEK